MRKLILVLGIILSCQFAFGNEIGRQKININASWKFQSKILSNNPAFVDFDDKSWSIVNIPHTWNNTDAQDGGNNYLRTVGWYRKSLPWNDSYNGKKLYIEFLGACLQAECFVNGKSAGIHKGGYTAFRFDITSLMKPGENIIAVKVDNRHSEEIMPLGGDFSVLGGIYRNVSLIVVDPVHVDLMDNGSSGLYLTPVNVSESSADLEIKALIFNHSSEPKTVIINGKLRNPDSFESIADVPKPTFDVTAMCPGGKVIKTLNELVTIEPGKSYRFEKKITIERPHLWNGKKDPYRYLVDLEIEENGNVIDMVSEYVGFRYYSVTKEGFFLNGKLYPLRGVGKHQDRYNMGYAVTDKEQNEDFGMIYDMGANAIRLAHYPHDPYIYDLCDRYGLAVWTEIPLVDRPGTAESFNEVTKDQLRELIRQHYNCPSVFFWGLQNEIREQHDTHMRALMKELNELAHAEDPSRLTVQATNHHTAKNWDSDVFAWNYYPGWYVQNPLFSGKLDSFKDSESRPTALSEYGAGGSIYHHEINPAKPVTNGGDFHPEEYQNKVHEQAIIDISTRDFVWGTFLWNIFDFASDARKEGDQHGVNDKGLITYDRKVKKDSYYAYKANWSNEPFVYITSRRYANRNEEVTPISIYSNCESVELFVNGESKGKIVSKDVRCGFFKWDDIILLANTENKIKVVGTQEQKEYTDEVVWTKIAGTTTTLQSDKLVVNNDNKRIIFKENIPVEQIYSYLQALDGATFIVVEADGKTPVTKGMVSLGMKIVVTSEDTQNKATYEFIAGHIALKKNITTDSEQTNEDNLACYAVDGDYNTRWASKDKNPHWLEIDLGKEYVLNKITIHWFNPNGSRTYQYHIKTAGNEKEFEIEVDRSGNTQPNAVSDNLQNKSRFVRVEVLGGNASTAYPSLYEIEVLGWTIESEEYDIDFENRKIKILNTKENVQNLTTEKFLSNISFEGNLSYVLNSMSYFIQENDELVITDYSGNKMKFKCVFTNNLTSVKNTDRKTFQITSQNNTLTVRLTDFIEPVTLEIRDLLGHTIVTEEISNSYTCRLDNGFYLVSLSNPQLRSETVKCLIK